MDQGVSRRGRGGKSRGDRRGDTQTDSEASQSSDLSMSESCSVNSSTDLSLEDDLGRLQLQQYLHQSPGNYSLQPPQQRSKNLFPALQNTGRPCVLQSNHFNLEVKVPKGDVHMYEVNIIPPWTRPYRRSDKVLYQETIRRWKEVCPAVSSEQHCWVFDGYNQLYSTRRHHSAQFQPTRISVWSAEEERMVDMLVGEVVHIKVIKVNKDILDWACRGRSGEIPQDALEALNVVLKQAAVTDLGWTSIGRCLFRPEGKTIDLGFGKETWTGVFSTIRPMGWKDHGVLLTLNVDTFNKPAVKSLHLTNGGDREGYISEVLSSRKYGTLDLRKGLTAVQINALSKDLKELKVRYEVPDKNGVRKRQYRVNDVRKLEACKEKINVDGELISIVQYFKKQYNLTLKYPNLPCLWVGARDKTIYIPMEFCSLVSQPMPRKKKLPDEAVATMIRQTAIKPLDRQKRIMEELQRNNAMYKKDPYAREFGISLAGQMMTLHGRILTPPRIEYRNQRSVQIKEDNPGKWFMSKNNLYVDGRRLSSWAVLDFSGLTDLQLNQVITEFCTVGKASGLTFPDPKSVLRVNGGKAEDALDKIDKYLRKMKERKMELVLIVLPFKASLLYDKIKRWGDIELDLSTQCCLRSNLFKNGELNRQVIANICLKINSKLGGKNHVLCKTDRCSVLDRPVMMMGADVSHPAPEARGLRPSIAAIVASTDPKATSYEVEIRVQDTSLDVSSNEEVISDMKNVTKALLKKFYQVNHKRKPEKLVMFRDGVSEGQFLKVLSQELVAIREACMELEKGYEPAITFIVVQKRHHTRFFPADNNKYKNGNALAGTVVDQGINHPTEGDFYLVSHEGIQGTSRPCHYHVLWDDSNFSAEQVETLAYYLCHLYSRCTRSVSYPTPTYYAHLVADRARKHHNDLAGAAECGGSTSGSAGSVRLSEADRRRIQEVIESGVSSQMYFV